jgi:hypothetical protein
MSITPPQPSTAAAAKQPKGKQVLADLRRRFDFTDAEVDRQLIRKMPLLKNTEVMNTASNMDFLTTRLLLKNNELRRLILDTPTLLTLNINDDIEPKLAYLEKRLLLEQEYRPC